jgi:signal transduction histidine kinase
MKVPSSVDSPAGTLAISISLVALIGWVDYLTGEFSLAVFYLIPICLAAWHLGRTTGVVIALLSVTVWFLGDIALWRSRNHPLMPYWNAMILVSIYCVVVHLLCGLRRLQLDLEARVGRRTAALAEANAELKAMEQVLLGITERERRRIGADLHDSLGQKLTAASLTANGLLLALDSAKPELMALAESVGAQLREAIAETRALSHGLAPVPLQDDGLMHALHALADSTARTGKLRCVFECPRPVNVSDASVAGQFYRIAQEAVNNALKHASPGEIRIGIERVGDVLAMEIEDDGRGLPEPVPAGTGIGLRVMNHRVQMLGGTLEISSSPAGGTRVSCRASSP